ncbi:uncharacterized protein LOC111267261 isoform X2 [Varroa jacobsoni]|uniref:MEIOB-like N-terminal domain-containing protein n=1 Tax=Varroa destructor TaxID=109461 RepID=A0A7M7JMT8_VARDE|nr:uncharacterized protein LOC111245064 [Varroa destructor]XP_022701127.1 uncharacterized protein LOC111267261 isoform X2 [Varroa jacobsoni]
MENVHLLSDIKPPLSIVTVEVCVLQRQPVREIGSRTASRFGEGRRAVLNFVVKDIMGDTANVVYWGTPDNAHRISSLLPIGAAVRLPFLKVTGPRKGSYQFTPCCTCQMVLELQHPESQCQAVKVAHPRNIHRLTQALHVPPVMRADSKSIKELLAEQLECNVTIMAVVVDIGLPEEVNTRNGVEKRLMLELADQSSQTILMTVWGDMAQYLKDQCLPWDTVVLLQDARLTVSTRFGNQIQTSPRTLITVDVTGADANEIKNLVQIEARLQRLQPMKLNRETTRLTQYEPPGLPQWVTLQVLAYLNKTGLPPPTVEISRPFITIALLTRWDEPSVWGRCKKCHTSSTEFLYSIADPNKLRCALCGTDARNLQERRLHVPGFFSDSYGEIRLLLREQHIELLIGRTEALDPVKLMDLLDDLQWQRFVLEFYVQPAGEGEEGKNAIRLLRISSPTSQQWTLYLDAVL